MISRITRHEKVLSVASILIKVMVEVMYSRVVFWRRYILGEREEKARSQPLSPTIELYVRCYFETDFGQLRLAWLRLRREIGKALKLDKIVDLCKKLSCRQGRQSRK